MHRSITNKFDNDHNHSFRQHIGKETLIIKKKRMAKKSGLQPTTKLGIGLGVVALFTVITLAIAIAALVKTLDGGQNNVTIKEANGFGGASGTNLTLSTTVPEGSLLLVGPNGSLIPALSSNVTSALVTGLDNNDLSQLSPNNSLLQTMNQVVSRTSNWLCQQTKATPRTLLPYDTFVSIFDGMSKTGSLMIPGGLSAGHTVYGEAKTKNLGTQAEGYMKRQTTFRISLNGVEIGLAVLEAQEVETLLGTNLCLRFMVQYQGEGVVVCSGTLLSTWLQGMTAFAYQVGVFQFQETDYDWTKESELDVQIKYDQNNDADRYFRCMSFSLTSSSFGIS